MSTSKYIVRKLLFNHGKSYIDGMLGDGSKGAACGERLLLL